MPRIRFFDRLAGAALTAAMCGALACNSGEGGGSRTSSPPGGASDRDDSGDEDRVDDGRDDETAPGSDKPASRKERCFQAGDVISPEASALEGSFFAACSGCHGKAGQGVGKIPAVTGDIDFATFEKVVRDGRQGKAGVMPAFAAEHISDADLLVTYATLRGSPVAAPRDVACASTGEFAAAEVDAAIAAGLQAWRKPDAEGAACASCHGPAPFDLALIGYDDATIFRRALKHISEDDTRLITRMVAALRARYGLGGPRDFLAFRPFQPGGVVLAGNTDAERDHAFGMNLAQAAPALGEGIVDDAGKAQAARDQLLALNPRTFPIGIALNRWTEDEFHGGEHATLNDWIPDRPRVPRDEAAAARLYQLHDSYLENPSWDAIWAIQDGLDELTTIKDVAADTVAWRLFDLKYKSVLFAQHHFRLKAEGKPGFEGLNAAPFPGRNSLWNLGDLVRVNDGRECNGVWTDCYGLPMESTTKLLADMPVRIELARLRRSWFYVGWQFDVTLYHTSGSNSTKSSEYFTRDLYGEADLRERYFNHLTYLRFRKNLASAYEAVGVGADEQAPLGVDHPNAQNYGYFLGYYRGLREDKMPVAGPHRDLYVKLVANSMRMMLFLLLDKMQTSGQVYDRAFIADLVGENSFAAFLQQWGGRWPTDQALLAQVKDAAAAACESKPLSYKQTPYPGHCMAM